MQLQWLSKLWYILGSAGVSAAELDRRHDGTGQRSLGVFHPRSRRSRLQCGVLLG